jgi:ABC-type polysaccharide/polyol phosphate export permease
MNKYQIERIAAFIMQHLIEALVVIICATPFLMLFHSWKWICVPVALFAFMFLTMGVCVRVFGMREHVLLKINHK